MDELLALMEEAEAHPTETQPSDGVAQSLPSSSSTTDDQSQARTVTPAEAALKKKRKKASATEKADAKIDQQFQMRMLDRKVKSLDLLELMQTRNYHSPTALVKMNSSTLNQKILVEPVLVLQPASNVCGNTNLLTIGLVFNNSGTKIAAKGNAFCILSLGSNIVSGPTVSILLFGAAYSKCCQTIKPGMIIGLENPRLIPQKPNKSIQDTTKISFSINEEGRLFVIAKAKDYGVCQAPVRGKNANGNWVSNAHRCPTAIDVRGGNKYCYLHRNLDSTNSKIVEKGTFIQQQKQQAAANNSKGKKGSLAQKLGLHVNNQSLRKNGALVLPNNKGQAAGSSRGAGSAGSRGVPTQMSRVQAPAAPNRFNHNNRSKLANNRLLNPPAGIQNNNPYSKQPPKNVKGLYIRQGAKRVAQPSLQIVQGHTKKAKSANSGLHFVNSKRTAGGSFFGSSLTQGNQNFDHEALMKAKGRFRR